LQLAVGKIETVNEGYRVNDQYTMKVQGVDPVLVNIDGKQFLRAALPADTRSKIIQTITW
jgi:hypothetical protein